MPTLPFVLRIAILTPLLGFGVVAGWPAGIATQAAYAQSPVVFEGAGLIELMPVSGIVGDGATTADLYVLAVRPGGEPLAGLQVKPTVSTGTVSGWTDAGGGLYRLSYTPPNVDARVMATLTLKGKIGKENLQKNFSFAVSPPRTHRVQMAANPARMTLGQDRTATLSFTLVGGDRSALAGLDLAINASSGTIENITNLGGGQFTALYTAPGVNYPHVALITVADKRDPSRTYGGLAIPLSGRVDFPVTVAGGNRVIIKIGDQQFGPIQADAQGRARVPILVPPGAQVADKISVAADGKTASEPLDLKVPEGRRITLVPTAVSFPSDARLQIPVHAFVTGADGKPDLAAQVQFSATAGSVGAARSEGNGIYTAIFTPPNGGSSAQATLTASLADHPTGQAASVPVNLVAARPSAVTLTPEPSVLPASADGFKVLAKVLGPDGSGLGARNLSFSASGARLKGEVKDLRNGDYQAIFSTTGSGPVELSAIAATPATGNPLARVLLVPSRSRLTNDGLSSAMITVVSVDEFGYPVPNVAVTLKLAGGGGTLPASATTGADGVAQVHYTAGRSAGLVTIEAAAGDSVAATGLVQAPDALALPNIPTGGPKTEAALIGEWDKALAEVRVEREGMQGAVIPPAAPTVVGGARPSRAAMVSDPATVSPGGNVKLRINLTDEAGRGVAGQQLDFLTSVGTVGAVTEIGGGQYEANLTVPPSASGDVKVSVATRDGGVSSFMRVPVGGAEAAWSTATPFRTTEPAVDPYATPAPTPAYAPTAAPSPVATTTTVVTTTAAADHPWLRIRAGVNYGWYQYNELPASQKTVFFPLELGLSSPALGGSTRLRVFGPASVGGSAASSGLLGVIRYLGGEVDFRGMGYDVDSGALCEGLELYRNDQTEETGGEPVDYACETAENLKPLQYAVRGVLIPRYPFAVGNSEFHVGARIGGGNSNQLAYIVKVDDSIVPTYVNSGSLLLGAELAAEIGSSLFFQTSFNEHLAGGATPYNTEFDVEAGYSFLPNVYASLAYGLSVREVVVDTTSGSSATLTDTSNSGVLSVGFQL